MVPICSGMGATNLKFWASAHRLPPVIVITQNVFSPLELERLFQVGVLQNPGCSDEIFETDVNNDLLWTPPHRDHDHWITVLVKKLITCDNLHDDVLRLLTPGCEVRVSCKTISNYLILNQ